MVHGPWTRWPLDVRHAEFAGRLQKNFSRTSTFPRARISARNTAGGRGCSARADPAIRPRQQERADWPGSHVPGRTAIRSHPGYATTTRGKHRQGDHQGRRHVLHVLPGHLVYGQHSERPMDPRDKSARRNIRNPHELSGA